MPHEWLTLRDGHMAWQNLSQQAWWTHAVLDTLITGLFASHLGHGRLGPIKAQTQPQVPDADGETEENNSALFRNNCVQTSAFLVKIPYTDAEHRLRLPSVVIITLPMTVIAKLSLFLLKSPNVTISDEPAVVTLKKATHNNGEPALLLGVVMRDGWNGLELGRALKLKYPAATVVVFGKIEGEGASTTRVKERWGIDVHMPFLPQPADVAALVDTVRLARARDVAKEAARLRPPEPRRADPAWRELLTEPITSETFKTILRKDLLAR